MPETPEFRNSSNVINFHPISLLLTKDQIQSSLLILAGIFLGLFSLALTLAPTARARSWDAELSWSHWIGFGVWVLLFIIANRQTQKYLPNRDPYLLPITGVLTGWGLFSIWRLNDYFGVRQLVWLSIGMGILIISLHFASDLSLLRRYKYIWLSIGLIITALTLIFGTNPAGGSGQRLWLGCCGIYLQPSEPLKLLLIIYLAAYLADRHSVSQVVNPEEQTRQTVITQVRSQIKLLPLLAPAIVIIGLTTLLLLVQRDLGTATIFIFLFAILAFLATGNYFVLIISGLVVASAAILGYFNFEVVKLRIDAWLNPWLDPSGGSYQIVQSLLAIANGGIGGRGPGLGNPGLVPVSHSDFIFSAMIEETGMIGGVAFVVILAILVVRGILIALSAPDSFRRLLAAGLTTYLAGQSILIIGGNLRLLPLTGVTLPLVSYGGSSLVTALISILLLLQISESTAATSASKVFSKPYYWLAGFLLAGLVIITLGLGWWAYWRGPDLLQRTDNARRSIADRYVRRGTLLDRRDSPLAISEGVSGDYVRRYLYPDLGSILGYTDPVYGQSGLEMVLDPYLRGLEGYPVLVGWWNHLLYGQPPPGLDVRLSLDLDLQRQADELLGDHTGAIVMLNAATGEILAMASNPTFDPNNLEETWSALVSDPGKPLIDRAAQGQYKVGGSLNPFLLAKAASLERLPMQSSEIDPETSASVGKCAIKPADSSWFALIAAGCPWMSQKVTNLLSTEEINQLVIDLGLTQPSDLEDGLGVPGVVPDTAEDTGDILNAQSLQVSPLQMARAAATLSGHGELPSPRIGLAVNLPESGWTIIDSGQQPARSFSNEIADQIAIKLASQSMPIWESIAQPKDAASKPLTWYLAGTLPEWPGTPISLVVLLEESSPTLAQKIGRALLTNTLQP